MNLGPEINGLVASLNGNNIPLVWMPELGVGYYPVDDSDSPYDAAYFAKYVQYENTPIGRAINAFRVDLVSKHIGSDQLVDIGIGSGAFIKARGRNTVGYDINPESLRWLAEQGMLWDNPENGVVNASFWDSLEHLPNPGEMVRHRQVVFVSLPIFEDFNHVLRSKHFRKTEHRWYWTRAGLINWFSGMGFACVERNTEETRIGREDIETFVFAKVRH